MITPDIVRLIETDKDYINIKRFDFSLEKLLDRYPDGVPERVIAQALAMEEEEVQELYNSVVIKLREKMGVDFL